MRPLTQIIKPSVSVEPINVSNGVSTLGENDCSKHSIKLLSPRLFTVSLIRFVYYGIDYCSLLWVFSATAIQLVISQRLVISDKGVGRLKDWEISWQICLFDCSLDEGKQFDHFRDVCL